MEESLQEYQAILAHAEEIANLGSWKWDLRTKKVTWSDGMFRLFGVDHESFDGDLDRIIADRIHPDDMPAVRESNRRVLEDGVPLPLSYRIVLLDGKERTVWAQGKLLYDENGQPVCLTGYVQDITGRVQAENRIIQLKRMYATLSQVNQMIVHVREREELFRTICEVTVKYGEFSLAWIGLVNEASGEVQPVAAYGLDLKNWPHPMVNAKQGPYQNRLIAEAIGTSQVVTAEDIQIDERTSKLHIYIQDFPIHSMAIVPFRLRGRPIGVLVLTSEQRGLFKEKEEINLLEEMAVDISFALDNIENENERQQAEKALQESENRYRDLVETSQDGIFINRQGQIVFINRRGLEMLGATSYDQILGRSPFEFFHPDVHPIVRERIKQILTSQTPVPPMEEKIVTLDGRTVPVEVTAAQVQVNGIPSIQVILRDITERKQAEERLRHSEERYRLISENTADVIWVLDPLAGRFKYISPSVERLRGYTPAEIMERPISEALTPDSFVLISQLLAEHLPLFLANGSNSKSLVTEVDQPCKDGTIVHTEVTTTMVFNQQGEVEVIGVSRNITERKQAEQALRENEERLRLSLQAANQGLYDLNVQTGDAIVNREYAQMLGYDPETFVETNARWIERLHPADRESVAKAYQDYVNGLRPDYRIEFRQKTRDGNWKWILSLGRVIEYDEQERPLRMMGTHTDITERKQAEDALKRNEHVLRLFVEHSPASIAMFDREMRYIVASRRYLVDYRLSDQEDLTGRSHYEVFPEMPERWKDIHRRCLRGAIEKAEEDPFPREDGRLDWVRWEIHPWYEESGNVGGLILFSEVITERKQVQDDLRLLNLSLEQRVMERTLELWHANRAKDEFLANMSHELRTPLNAILGLSESLLEQRRGHLNDRQIQSIELIASSGRHLLSLINDILEVSKIEAGKLQLHTGSVSVRELCDSSLNFIKELALKKLIAVEFTQEDGLSTIQADPQRIKQILINLLTNAVKFTPERGRVGLDVSINTDRDRILFTVSDTGIGIAAEDLKKLFTPFTQLDSSLARQYTGTGLGLSLVRKLTELHGGSVEVESETGRGSRFTVALPLAQDPGALSLSENAAVYEGHPSNPAPLLNRGERGVALLAEDNRNNSEMLVEYLENYGYTVLAARNGEEVLQRVEETLPDIILMDIQMPGMDGLETTRHLRQDCRFATTPIIALTALVMAGDRERCFAAGVNEYLSKPVSLRALLSTMEKLMEAKK